MSRSFPLYVPLIGKDQLSPMLARAGAKVGALGGKMTRVGKKMSIGLTAPVIGAGIAIFRTGANFEKGMNRVRALSGATGNDLQALRDQAMLLGRTTVHSATEAAQAQGLLAQAGFNTKEMLSTLPGVLDLASAGQIGLGEAANISANVLRGYNLEASRSGMVSDVLAKAQASANVTIEELGEAFKMAGPLASAAGLDFNETAAALALVADKGFKGTMGGTAFRNMLLKMGKPSAEAVEALSRLGVERDKILDTDGNVRSFKALVAEFEKSGATITQLNTIFGERAVGPFQALVSAGSEALAGMEGKLKGSAGDAQRMAKEQLEGTAGSWARFTSSLEGFMLKLGESGVLQQMTDGLAIITNVLSDLAQKEPGLLKVGTSLVLMAAVVGPLLSVLGSGIGVLTGVGGALLKTGKVVKWVWMLMRANPIGALITAGMLLASLGVHIAKKWDSSMGIWANLKTIFKDLAVNGIGWVLDKLKSLAEWALPDWALRLMGLADGSTSTGVGTASPVGGGPAVSSAQLATIAGTAGAGGKGGDASMKVEIVAPPGLAKLSKIQSEGLDLTVSRGVGMQAVTG